MYPRGLLVELLVVLRAEEGWRRDRSERMNATAPPRFGGIWRPTPLPHVLKMSSPDNTVSLTLFFSSPMAFLRSK